MLLRKNKKFDRFLKFFGLFNILSFIIVIIMCAFIAVSYPDSFCFEVEDEFSDPVVEFVFVDNTTFNVSSYSPSTNCTLVSYSELKYKKQSFHSFFLFSVVCLLGFIIFSPEFQQKIKFLIKKFK